MPDQKYHKTISKLMSLVLRHQPEKIGLSLDENGWADVEELIQKIQENGKSIDRTLLEEVVRTSDKQRFRFSEDGTKIKANQGHSLAIEHGFEPVTPPEVLYHGTAEQNETSILQHGLDKRNRHHVHLSGGTQTAVKVGQRHGKPLVLKILSGQMHADGHLFYRSENGVWLTESVPAAYIKTAEK